MPTIAKLQLLYCVAIKGWENISATCVEQGLTDMQNELDAWKPAVTSFFDARQAEYLQENK